MFPVTVTKGHVIQVRGGAVHHDDIVGKPYGSKVLSLWWHRTTITITKEINVDVLCLIDVWSGNYF